MFELRRCCTLQRRLAVTIIIIIIIRIGVQYTCMRNNPERFIESSTDHSWLRYLAYMSQQGMWADAIVIQAVADALNLTIHIIESNPGFALVTNISPVSSEIDTTIITIGHLHEVHYVSTVPFNEQAMAFNVQSDLY